jgi:multicomponent Na+:H+ antiporter subunit G
VNLLLDLLAGMLLFAGGFMCLSGAVGLLRFPDFYTRMHATAITDSLGGGCILVGLMLFSGYQPLVLAKLLLILLLLLLTSPTSSHALSKAALHSGLPPGKGGADKHR